MEFASLSVSFVISDDFHMPPLPCVSAVNLPLGFLCFRPFNFFPESVFIRIHPWLK